MSQPEHLLVERVGTDGRILQITLNRPEVLNALAPQTFRELLGVLQEAEPDNDIRVVVLKGAGRAFSSGHDLGDAYLSASALTPQHGFTVSDADDRPLTNNIAASLRQVTDIMLYLWRLPKVTIAQTHGYCLGGGLELAMMADLLVTSDDCVLGHPAHRGVGSARNAMLLPLIVGMRKAKELFFTGDTFSGVEAERLGIANHAWPAAELDERTLAFADRLANLSADHLGVLKASMNQFYENMGLYSSVYSATRFDAMAQLTGSSYEWQDNLAQLGLRAALQVRDGPYGET